MQAIKDLVCSDDPINHQLGLILAFTEYGKSFETFMMVLDWHSSHDYNIYFIDLYILSDLLLFINWEHGTTSIYFLNEEDENLNLEMFINNNTDHMIFDIFMDTDDKSVYLIEEQLKSIYHFLTYYDII